MRAQATGRGDAKLIVFGEHSVVYGRPAVAAGLPSGAEATVRRSDDPGLTIDHPGGRLPVDDQLEVAADALLSVFDVDPDRLAIHVDIQIPVGVGLGSSAALATAISRALARLTGLRGREANATVEEAVAASETVFHGSPSGIDQCAAIDGRFFSFSPNDNQPVTRLDVPATTWVVARVGPPSSTAEMVASVRQLRARKRQFIESLFDDVADLTRRGIRALEAGDWKTVGEAMNRNQRLLKKLDVSTPDLDVACRAARDAGALGAKLTGAGGGGCIVALPPADDIDAVGRALQDHGEVFRFEL